MMFIIRSIFRTVPWVIVNLFVFILIPFTSTEIKAQESCNGTKPLKFIWTAASGNVDHYNVYVSTDEEAYILEAITYELTYTITGTHGHSYKMRVEAADAAGNVGPMSEESDIVVCDACSPEAVVDLRAAAYTTSITLTWTAPGDDGNLGTASEYDIRYSTSPITDSNWNDAIQVADEPMPQIAGNSETFTVTGLSSGITYYFAIKAADEALNWSGLSNVVTVKTLLADVTSMSQVHTFKIQFNKETHQFSMMSNWKNVGIDQFSQPLQMVIESITPSTVIVANEDGTTPDGKPYYDYSNFVGDGKLEPGEISENKQFIFNSPERVKFEIDLSCWAKMGGVNPSPKIKPLIGQAKKIHIVIPAVSALAQNFPNPFNPETWIPYELSDESEVRIYIYDVQGKLVRKVDLGHKEVGQYFSKGKAAYWDGRNNFGEKTGSGVYFYQIQAGDFQSVRKMVILK